MRLELVRLRVKRDEVGDTEVGSSRGELVAHRKRHQGRVSPRTAAGDLDPCGIDVSALGEVAHGRCAVLDIDHAPRSAEPVAILAAVSGASAVVQVDDRDPATREELDLQVERRRHVRRRAAVHQDDQRRQLALGTFVVRIRRRVVETVRRLSAGPGELDRLRNRDVPLVQLHLGRSAKNLPLAGFGVELDHGRGLRRRGCGEDDARPVTAERR